MMPRPLLLIAALAAAHSPRASCTEPEGTADAPATGAAPAQTSRRALLTTTATGAAALFSPLASAGSKLEGTSRCPTARGSSAVPGPEGSGAASASA